MELRSDYRQIAAVYDEFRAPERLIAHYELERRIADEMRNSTPEQRADGLYTKLYDRLLGELEDHPRKTLHNGPRRKSQGEYVQRQANMIIKESKPDDVFLEIGGGDCKVALLVAPHVAKSMVVDVSNALVPNDIPVDNFEFVKTTGVQVPLPSDSVSFIYSNQLMEHLHPDDAMVQVRELYRVLKPGGKYLCRTPNRHTGPHDVSMFFDTVARGMHMREYSYADLGRIFEEAGFRRMRILVAPRAYSLFSLPRFAAEAFEKLFAAVPRSLHTRICRSRVARALLGITVIAEKPA